MCCFSGPVDRVTNTNIFARAIPDRRQVLVYEMTFAAAAEVAMVLPVPVPPGSPEDSLKFIALDGYRNFFDDLKRGFPVSRSIPGTRSQSVPQPARLRVVEVGDFEASFVPTRDDFDRLDSRFRMPTAVWDDLRAYRDFGFAVFKLKPGRRRVHPMAFEFPRRDRKRVFFPTVHVHDGVVHRDAEFDHTLYLQGEARRGWDPSYDVASEFMNGDDHGLVDRRALLYRRELRGRHRNEDIYV